MLPAISSTVLPLLALCILNTCNQECTAQTIMSAVNSELTRKHAATNLKHLMKLPHSTAAAHGIDLPEKKTETINYSHNITHSDGAHDFVHYNVSSEVGVISLDFIPEVVTVECATGVVTVRLSDIAVTNEWRSGVALVGDRTWGCLGVPVGAETGSRRSEVEWVPLDEGVTIITPTIAFCIVCTYMENIYQ